MIDLPIQHGYSDPAAIRVCQGLILMACAVGLLALLGLAKNLILRRLR